MNVAINEATFGLSKIVLTNVAYVTRLIQNSSIQTKMTVTSEYMNTSNHLPMNVKQIAMMTNSKKNQIYQLTQNVVKVAPIIFNPSLILSAFSSTNALTI